MELRIREADKGREEKKKHCHGMTRENTERGKDRSSRLATEGHGISRKEKHIFQSRMRKRRL